MGNLQAARNKACIRFIMSKLFQTKFSRLIAAIKAGNLSLVKFFFKDKVNFNQYLQNGDTPLHIAVKYNKLEIVKFIGDNIPHLNFNDKNFAGDTPLMLAVMNRNMKLVEYFVLKKFVDLNIPENRGFTPFIAACAGGDLGLVKFLVKHGCNYRMKSKDGQTGLHRAAFYGNTEIVRYLIKELKMNILLPDRKGNLPLHLACLQVNISCIRILSRASNRSTKELLHYENKYGVKPISLLVKVLNKMRHPDEPIDFEDEQIEEYIKDKRNMPIYKKAFSPISAQKSSIAERYDIFRMTKKGTLTDRNVFIGDSPLLRPKPVVSDEIASPMVKETEEEELMKYKNTVNDSIPDLPPLIPLLSLNRQSFASSDMSPSTTSNKTAKGQSPSFRQDGKPILKINTKFSGRLRSSSREGEKDRERSSVSSTEEGKAMLFAPVIKSRFAIQSSSIPDDPQSSPPDPKSSFDKV